jgi:uncharacterized RDD family membrane protein YckC
MINPQLLDYVTKESARGVSHADIEKAAVAAGWNAAEVAVALGNPVPQVAIKYAGFWVRFVAVMVDGVVLIIPAAILSGILGGISIGFHLSSVFSHMLSFITNIMVWIYFILMTHYNGATLGKMLVGITVRSDTNGKLTIGQVILRETVGKLISSIIFSIGYIMAAFTKNKQALHDKLAHSVVVYKDPSNPNKAGIIIGTIIAVIIPGIIIVGILSSIVLVSLSVARQKGMETRANYNSYNAINNHDFGTPDNPGILVQPK